MRRNGVACWRWWTCYLAGKSCDWLIATVTSELRWWWWWWWWCEQLAATAAVYCTYVYVCVCVCVRRLMVTPASCVRHAPATSIKFSSTSRTTLTPTWATRWEAGALLMRITLDAVSCLPMIFPIGARARQQRTLSCRTSLLTPMLVSVHVLVVRSAGLAETLVSTDRSNSSLYHQSNPSVTFQEKVHLA